MLAEPQVPPDARIEAPCPPERGKASLREGSLEQLGEWVREDLRDVGVYVD